MDVVYTKDSKHSFVNTFEPTNAPALDFKDDFTKLSLKTNNTMGWKGDPLGENDEIQIQITQGDKSISLLTQGIGTSFIKINNLETVKFRKGKAKISLLRKHTIDEISNPDKTAGGRVSYASEVVKEINID